MMSEQEKRDLWLTHFENRKLCGMTVKEYCKANGISGNTYWKYHRLYVDTPDESNEDASEETNDTDGQDSADQRLSRTPPARSTTASFHANGITVTVSESVSDAFLRKIVKALSR